MDESARAFTLKVVGILAGLGIGVAGLWSPPLLTTGVPLSIAFITAALIATGVNIGATIAAGREANMLRQARRPSPRE